MTRIETFGHRIGSGATAVVTGIAHWPSKGENGEKKAGRWIVLGGSGWLTEQLVARTHPLALVVAAGFLAGAWRQGTAPEPEPVEDDTEPEFTAAETRQLIVDSVHHLAHGKANVHLANLFDHMEGEAWCADLSEFRRWAESYDVPVRDSVKANGTTRVGIRVTDLQQAAGTPTATTPPTVPDDLLQDW